MKRGSLLHLIQSEGDRVFTYWLLKLLDGLSWCASAAIVRAQVLRWAGFRIGRNTRIMTGVNITSRRSDIEIGDGTFINKNVFFDASDPVRIGKHCQIGFNTVFTNSSHELNSDFKGRRPDLPGGPITLEDFVWIGCNVIILGGVTIGRGAVVSSGSLVYKDIPPNSVAAGNPARIIQKLEVPGNETATSEAVVSTAPQTPLAASH